MKICFWLTQIFSLGGTKRVTTDLANALSDMGHDVTIMTHENRMAENRYMYGLKPSVKVDYINIHDFFDSDTHKLPNLCRKLIIKCNTKTGCFNNPRHAEMLANQLFPPKSRSKMAAYLNSKNYDVVIAAARMALWLALTAPELNCKTVGWEHGTYDGYINVKGAIFEKQEQILKKYIPNLDTYAVLTIYDQQRFKKELDLDVQVRTNPCNMSASVLSDHSSKRFLIMSRLVQLKGIDLAIEAFAKFAQRDSEWELDIVGDGPVRGALKKLIADKGLENRIHMPGFTSDPMKYYLNSSILLMPSRWEGWGMSVIEANICGLPAIAFHTSSLDLVVKDGQTGLLVEAFDTDQYAKAMLRMAQDKQLRMEYAKNGIAFANQFQAPHIAKEWIEMLENL